MTTRHDRPWAVLTVLSLAYFLTQLDVAVVAVAVPDLSGSFHATTERVVWSLATYSLVLAVALITAGRFGDRYGHRRLFLTGVAIFLAGSLIAGAAGTTTELSVGRAVQGLGAALLVPQTLALLFTAIPADKRGLALGIRGAVGGVAVIGAPVVGGALIGLDSWRWIFYLNVPVAVVVLALGWVLLPAGGDTSGAAPLDPAGILLSALALGGMAYTLSQGRLGPLTLLAAASGVALLVRKRRQPDGFALARIRSFVLMTGYAATTSGTVVGIVVALSVHLQAAPGLDPLSTGLLIAPASVVSTVLDPVVGRLLSSVQGRHLLLAGSVLTVAGLLWLAVAMGGESTWPAYLGPIVVIGAGNAFLFTPMAAIGLSDVPAASTGAASGVLTTVLQFGSMGGAALTGALLTGPGGAQVAIVALAGVAMIGGGVSLALRRPSAVTLEPAA